MSFFDSDLKRPSSDFDDYVSYNFIVKHPKIAYVDDFPRGFLARNENDNTEIFEGDDRIDSFDVLFGQNNTFSAAVGPFPQVQKVQEPIKQGLESFFISENLPFNFSFPANGKASAETTDFSDRDSTILIKTRANNRNRKWLLLY